MVNHDKISDDIIPSKVNKTDNGNKIFNVKSQRFCFKVHKVISCDFKRMFQKDLTLKGVGLIPKQRIPSKLTLTTLGFTLPVAI